MFNFITKCSIKCSRLESHAIYVKGMMIVFKENTYSIRIVYTKIITKTRTTIVNNHPINLIEVGYKGKICIVLPLFF